MTNAVTFLNLSSFNAQSAKILFYSEQLRNLGDITDNYVHFIYNKVSKLMKKFS